MECRICATSRRPADGRYGRTLTVVNTIIQFQVVLKPSPDNIQESYIRVTTGIGIDPLNQDIRFVEDNWESPTLGAWGFGWEVLVKWNGNDTIYLFQQVGGLNVNR